jgi:hypothetical protein
LHARTTLRESNNTPRIEQPEETDTMSDLEIDVARLRAAADAVDAVAGGILVTNTAITVGGCGSTAVIAAAEDFNMWAKVAAQSLKGRLRSSAQAADEAATAYETIEAQIAESVG